MKAGLFLAALVQLASAVPHNGHHGRMHGKRQQVVTEVQTVTAVDHNAVVFVNQQGQAVSTSYCTESGPQATPQVYTSVVNAPAAPTAHSNPAPVAPAAPAAVPANQVAEAGAHHHKGHRGGHHGGHHGSALNHNLGMVYSPYNADNSCKSSDQVQSDLNKIQGYSLIRLYGVDCDQVQNVAPVAKAKGMKLFLGVYNLDNVASDLNTMHSALNGDWSDVDTVNIGNELVNSGGASASEVVSQLGQAKGILSGMGYNGPVVTVDTWNAILANPELCQASDFVAANCHAFFDSTITAANAGSWTKAKAQQLTNACGKKTIITEAGWPHAGYANGAAVPGVSEQNAAVSGLKSSFASGGLIMFTAFDDLWKTDFDGSFGAEKFWGVLNGQ